MKLTGQQTAALIANSAAGILSLIPGQSEAAAYFKALAAGVKAGANIDAHMQTVADKLARGPLTPADWADVRARIESGSDRLQNS